MTPFERRVYESLKKIPRGRITTYGIVATHLGMRGARAVGNAVAKNPDPSTIPCHRVVRSDGKLGGYAFGGMEKKTEILRGENIVVNDGKVVDFEAKIYRFED